MLQYANIFEVSALMTYNFLFLDHLNSLDWYRTVNKIKKRKKWNRYTKLIINIIFLKNLHTSNNFERTSASATDFACSGVCFPIWPNVQAVTASIWSSVSFSKIVANWITLCNNRKVYLNIWLCNIIYILYLYCFLYHRSNNSCSELIRMPSNITKCHYCW